MCTVLVYKNATYKFLAVFLLLLSVSASAQDTAYQHKEHVGAEINSGDTASEPYEICYVEEMPEFPGGNEAFFSYIKTNLKYPVKAKRANIEGKVFVAFIVTASGKVRSVEVMRSLGYGCDQEAIRLVKNMPNFIPGRRNGKAIDIKVSVPILFKLE